MGEAKRRKKLDPNYGKSSGLKREQGLNVFLMGNIAKKCYEKYGRGVLFNVPGDSPKYVLASCSWLKPVEIEYIESYDPSTEVVMAELRNKTSSSRTILKLSVSKANQLRLLSKLASIDDVVRLMFVATSDNEPVG